MKVKMIIHGSAFYLESFNEKYVTEEYVSWLKNSDIFGRIAHANPNVTIDDVRSYSNQLVESDDAYFFAIVMKKSNKHVGNVKLGPIDYENRSCQLGMMIGDVSYHGQGIGTETVTLCKEFCFSELNIRKLYVKVLTDNAKAIRIYKKNNFEKMRLIKKCFLLGNLSEDVWLMEVTNPVSEM